MDKALEKALLVGVMPTGFMQLYLHVELATGQMQLNRGACGGAEHYSGPAMSCSSAISLAT
jgi:hypothetical protein